MYELYIPNASAMKHLGACLANYVQPATSLWLQGPLGAGKTTLCQGLIQKLGYKHAVKSPTFTLVNSYTIERLLVHHFDFYRICDPYEFDLIGGRDYFASDAFCIIEWPERAEALLPPPTLSINLAIDEESRRIRMNSNSQYPIENIVKDFKS